MPLTFSTASGFVVPAVTAAEMLEVDRVAEAAGITLLQMMEHAGRNLALTVIERLPSTGPVVVLAGTGGNGGGGICAARHLRNHGVEVTLVVTDVDRLDPAPTAQLEAYRAGGGEAFPIASLRQLDAGLVVDALVGYSLQGAPRGPVRDAIDWVKNQRRTVVSLDVPSGIDATTGETPGTAVRADTTLTLALPKTGLGVELVGDLLLGDIGIPAALLRGLGHEVGDDLFRAGYRIPLRKA